MDREHKHHGGGFSNGFLLGTLVGGGLVFLLGTKKGKEIFKAMTENGFEGVTELKELLQDDLSDEAIDGYLQEEEANGVSGKEVSKTAKPIKRFFKRTRK